MQLVVDPIEDYAPVTLFRPGMTEEQFIEFCDGYPEYRVEYTAEGELEIMPLPGFRTGRRNQYISQSLGAWADLDGRGQVFDSSTLFLLPSGARRSPDASWIRHAKLRVAEADPRVNPELRPDFVIELRSESDRLYRLQRKMHEWIENGAQLGWLIDPIERAVTIYRPGAAPERVENPAEVAGEGPVAGFVLPMDRVWP